MGDRRTFLVVNPSSANGSVARRWDEIAATVRGEYGEFEHAFTKAPGDATLLARQALRDGYDLVVSLGGDGTMNEVVNGFFDAGQVVNPEALLGQIPVGTGGDFRKTAGIPKDVAAAAAALKGTATMRIDVGRLSLVVAGGHPAERHFVNIASFGVGGLVDAIVNSSSKALGGKASFFLATARAAIRYKNRTVRLSFDGAAPIERRIYNVAVANGRYFGGGMHIAPGAKLDDGLFDVVSLGDFGAAEAALRIRHLYKGTHLGLPKVEHWQARHVVAEPVDAGDQVLLDVDGEQPGSLPSTFELLPGALTLKILGDRMRVLLRLGLSVLAGVLTFLAVATFDVWPLMWVALVPLLFALRERSPGRAFLYGWLCGLTTNLGGFYWIEGLLQRFGHMPPVAAVPLWWLLCAYQGLIVAFFALFLRLVHRRVPGLPYALTVPVLMVTCELCVPLIFPWYYAISQAWVRPVIQIADLTGPLGVTFLLMIVNGALFDLLASVPDGLRPAGTIAGGDGNPPRVPISIGPRAAGRGWRWRPAVAAAVVVLAALGYGQVRIRQVTARRAAAPKVKVGVVQANIGIVEKGRMRLAPRHLAIHQELSAELQRRGAQLIVWPESSYPYYFDRGQAADWRDQKAVRKGFDAPILFGSITASRRERFPFNTALMMDRDGNITGSFDKVYLMIFGEYVPFYGTFESTISKYVPEASNFARGQDPAVFPFEQYRLGPMICYEDIIPQFGRRLAKLKPNLFVNITNDAWFGRTSEPYEHMALAVYRTVEHRLDMVRAVNTGVSAFIDATGRVYRKSPSVDPQETPDAPPVTLLDEVAMLEPGTVYGAVGDLFGYLCLTAAVYLLLIHGRFRRRAASAEDERPEEPAAG